jgi:hypothetical protein
MLCLGFSLNLLLLCYLAMVMGDNEIDDYQKFRQIATILIAMPPGQYGAMRMAQWSASMASCKATKCRHQTSAHAILSRRPPWSTISKRKETTLTKYNFYLAFSW